MRVGLFFGSFNPIHTGHLIIASSMVDNAELDQVWFVVSPQNPLKDKTDLLNEYDRLHLVQLAIENDERLRASSFEFSLPRPSYTIDTLIRMREKYPNHTFSLIMGSDSLPTLSRWKNHDVLLRDYNILVYPRHPDNDLYTDHPRVIRIAFPFLDISASYIRQQIKAGKSARYFLPEAVYTYVAEMNLYK
jgi:nicotinate-nucleotide adenylyltransferase